MAYCLTEDPARHMMTIVEEQLQKMPSSIMISNLLKKESPSEMNYLKKDTVAVLLSAYMI